LPVFAVSVGWIFREGAKRRIFPLIKTYFYTEAK